MLWQDETTMQYFLSIETLWLRAKTCIFISSHHGIIDNDEMRCSCNPILHGIQWCLGENCKSAASHHCRCFLERENGHLGKFRTA
jgi:hypothetical protein